MAAIATASTPPPSLFDAPNEKATRKNASCFMAKSSEVSLSNSSHDVSTNMPMDENNNSSMNPEIIAFDKCLSKLEGDNKKFFGALMTQLAEAHDLLDQKGEIEREDANELAALKTALEEEQQTVASLENESARLLKERDCAKAKLKVLKRTKPSLVMLMINLLRI